MLDVGEGPAVLILYGYGLRPSTYRATAQLLARRCRVLIPSLFEAASEWRPDTILDAICSLLDERGLAACSIIGHSFGGALELRLVARDPRRVRELVFADTLAMSREWRLAAEAMHPVHFLRMASPRAAVDFFHTSVEHPAQLIRAAWWAFMDDREPGATIVAEHAIPAHVLWASRDSLLAREDGEAFARDLRATFTVAHCPKGGPLDHDWMYRHPSLFVQHLERLRLKAFGSAHRAQN